MQTRTAQTGATLYASRSVEPRFASIPELIRQQAREHPEAVAFINPTRSWTYAELDEISNRVAHGLAAQGVSAGDTVAALTKHGAECVILLLAAGKLGAVMSPMNWRLASSELEYVISVNQPKVLVADKFMDPVLAETAMPGVKLKLVTEDEGGDSAFIVWARQFPATDPGAAPLPTDTAAQLFSSGTTGRPKAVELTHRSMLVQCEGWTEPFGYVPGRTVHLNVLPTFHVSGLVNALWMLYIHARAVFLPQFEPREWLRAVAEYGITDTFVVPAMLRAMVDLPDVRSFDVSGLRSIGYGGSPIDEALLVRCLEVFGPKFQQIFGMTECSGTVTLLAREDHEPSGARAALLRSVGQPASHISLRIADPISGAELSEGEVGEVWIRSDQTMKGYLGEPEVTACVFPEGREEHGGWFRSGDAGYLEDGYLYLHDRIKDMIISGGENIYPAEVESVVATHDAISEVAVIGVPDEKWGETVKACVVLRPGASVSEADLIQFVRGRLAHYKCPTSIDFVASLPRNPSGKVLKRILRDPYWQGRTRRIN